MTWSLPAFHCVCVHKHLHNRSDSEEPVGSIDEK